MHQFNFSCDWIILHFIIQKPILVYINIIQSDLNIETNILLLLALLIFIHIK